MSSLVLLILCSFNLIVLVCLILFYRGLRNPFNIGYEEGFKDGRTNLCGNYSLKGEEDDHLELNREFYEKYGFGKND